MRKVGMLFLVLFSISAKASEFSHIKLNPQFEQFITGPKNLHSLAKSNAIVSENPMGDKFRTAIFGTIQGPIPTDGEESPLYTEIRRNLEALHQDLGRSQVDQINMLNQQFNLGTQNFSGFSWQKPFGVIQVHADRQVTPNLFGANWLIQDTFVFAVEATTFLEKLSSSGLLNMSGVEIGAFAGITFKRVYTNYHYANSYQEGLTANFSKLFLPFVQFNQSGVEKMNHEEIMKREDFWSIRSGGLITSPPVYGVSLSGGVLAELAYQKMTMAQSTHTENPSAQRYRLAVNSKKSVEAGATLSLQLDFFKLLKFSLLSYDLNYEYAKSEEYNLSFTQPQWDHVKNDPKLVSEMRGILRGLGKVVTLEPYVVRLDESTSSAIESRSSILIWGKLQKSKTEQIRVIKDNTVRVFFKNYAQSMRVVQNIFSRIFSAVVYKLLKFPIGTSHAALYSRQLTMEYEATHPQASDPGILRIESTGQFSFVLTQSYDASVTHRWIDKRIKNDVIWFVDQFTTLSKDYKTHIRSEQLRGPLRVESNLRVDKAGFDHLLNTNENNVWENIALVCGSKNVSVWINEADRAVFLKKTLSGSESCVKNLGAKFVGFKTDYQVNSLMPSLKKFKDFMTDYYKRSGSLQSLTDLFGAGNSFINGRFEATTAKGVSFITSFSSGQFRGLGVIDNLKRADGSRTPASIRNE